MLPERERWAPLVETTRIVGAEPPAWSVVVPLWTREEGRSDLTAELTLTESSAGEIDLELDDLHVL